MAVRTVAGAMFATVKIILGRPLDVIGDYQIEPAIFVVVKPSRTGGPSVFISDAGSCGDIGEGAVAAVVVEDGAPVASDVDVRVAVVVLVTDGHALAVMRLAAATALSSDSS